MTKEKNIIDGCQGIIRPVATTSTTLEIRKDMDYNEQVSSLVSDCIYDIKELILRLIELGFNNNLYLEQILVIIEYRIPLECHIKMVLKDGKNLIKIQEDINKRHELVKDVNILKTLYRNIAINCNAFSLKLSDINHSCAAKKQKYLRQKGFSDWNTELILAAPNIYEIKNFSKEGRVYLLTNGTVDIKYRLITKYSKDLQYKDVPPRELFREIKAYLGDCSGTDLAEIVDVQNQIKVMNSKEKYEKLTKKTYKILGIDTILNPYK